MKTRREKKTIHMHFGSIASEPTTITSATTTTSTTTTTTKTTTVTAAAGAAKCVLGPRTVQSALMFSLHTQIDRKFGIRNDAVCSSCSCDPIKFSVKILPHISYIVLQRCSHIAICFSELNTPT